MTNSQPGEASAPANELGQPTLHEFLTRLASSPDARAAFDADPRAALDQAGLEGITEADVLQASSLVLDYAPIEVVEEYDRSLQSSVEKFAANTQFAAFNQVHPVHPHDQEVTEHSMLHSTPEQAPDFSQGGDVDQQLPEQPAPAQEQPANIDTDTEINDSGNLISVHDVANGNAIGNVGGNVGDTVGDVVGNTTGVVGEVTDTVEHTVDTGAEFGAGAGIELNNTVNNTLEAGGDVLGGVAGAAGNVHTLPVNEGPVEGITEGVAGPVQGVAEGVAGPVEGVTEGVTDGLPLDVL